MFVIIEVFGRIVRLLIYRWSLRCCGVLKLERSLVELGRCWGCLILFWLLFVIIRKRFGWVFRRLYCRWLLSWCVVVVWWWRIWSSCWVCGWRIRVSVICFLVWCLFGRKFIVCLRIVSRSRVRVFSLRVLGLVEGDLLVLRCVIVWVVLGLVV